jgi:ElaB/YqjD/DUF883 family membrane-anchored ribosome-binding protein
MIAGKSLDQPNTLSDGVAQSADHACKATQRVANEALDTLAVSMQGVRHQAAPLLDRASDEAEAVVKRGADALRDTAKQLRHTARRASETTVNYVRHEPVKAMLIAAATGAALMALISLMNRSRDRV